MGIISTSVSPAAGIITGNQTASNAARTTQTTTANSTQTINVGPSAAAVVSLSTDSQTRGASSGDRRSVDAAFEKQEFSGQSKSSEAEQPKGKGKVLNVTA